jgi:quinolinate synthase
MRCPRSIPLLTEFEKEHISERQALPEKYLGLSDAEMDARICRARRRSAAARHPRHHYQRDEVIKFADYTGDSFKLARQIAKRPTPTTLSSAVCTSWRRAPTS